MNRLTTGIATLALIVMTSPLALAHCEVPCGIYDDEARFVALAEHVQTLEKATRQITALNNDGEKNAHQIVRWVVTKEEHASAFQQIVAQYFLTQRIKRVEGEDEAAEAQYLELLEDAHMLLVLAMKAKQGTDLTVIEKLRKRLATFKARYSKPTH